jgi:hypothetical protein
VTTFVVEEDAPGWLDVGAAVPGTFELALEGFRRIVDLHHFLLGLSLLCLLLRHDDIP